MFETAGTLTIVELTSSLAALVLLPLVWAALATFRGVRGSGGRLAIRVAIAASGGTLALAVLHAVRAGQMPPGHVAQQHLATLARIGQLDIGLDLVRGPTSAACAVLVGFVGFVAVLHAVWTAPPGVMGRLAWIGLATSAVMLVALADGLPALALGLQIATIAGWAAAGGGKPRALVLAIGGDVAVVFAAWVLFWLLGGTFGASGYVPDPQPRFAIVAVPEAPRADGKSSVSLTTYEDALVSSDDGPPLPGEPLRSPFTLVLDPGIYSFRIQAGAATTDMLVTHVALTPGHAYVLTPYGPTTGLRNLDDQLAVPRPTPGGAVSMRTVLASRSAIFGVHATSVVGLVLVLAALLRLALLSRSKDGGLVYSLEVIPPLVLALRISPLLDPATAVVIAIVPALAAIVLAADAASSKSWDRAPRAVLAALAALAMASVLVGETAAAMVILVTAGLGAAAATASLEAEADVRWLGVACASLAGVLPGAGASPGIATAIAGALAAGSAGRWAGYVVAALVAVAAMLVSLTVFRVYRASIRAPVVLSGARAARALVVILAAGSLLGGALLGVGGSTFGAKTAPLARRLVEAPGGVDNVPAAAFTAVGVSLALAILGLVAARSATRTSAAPPWLAILGGPAALVARASRSASSLVRFFVRSVVIMNEDVIDDVTEAVASVFVGLGRAVRAVDTKLGSGLLARALGRSADEAVVRTGMDHPRRFERVRMGLVIGMVALLGLVVLSSVVLG